MDEDEPSAAVPRARSRPDRPADPHATRDSASAPDRSLPLENYTTLTIPQIFEKIPTLSDDQVRAIRDYEKSHRRRKTLLVKLERHLRPTEGPIRGADRSRPG